MGNARLFGLFVVLALAVTATVGAQQPITVEGTLVDSKCYLSMQESDNDHEGMGECGAMCLRMGQPAALVTTDNTFHAIIAPASALASHVGHTMRVTGTLHNGAIMATKVEMNTDGSWTEVKLNAMM